MNLVFELHDASSEAECREVLNKCLEIYRDKDPIAAFCLGELYHPETNLNFPAFQGVIEPSLEMAEAYYKNAFDWFSERASSGSVEAMRLLALFYQVGIHPVCRDYTKVVHWLNEAARHGDKSAEYEAAVYRLRMKEECS